MPFNAGGKQDIKGKGGMVYMEALSCLVASIMLFSTFYRIFLELVYACFNPLSVCFQYKH